MGLGTKPLIVFDYPEDFNSVWVDDVGTVQVTGGQDDPFGGTGAYSLSDNHASLIESRKSPDFTLNPNADGEAVCVWFLKQGTSGASDLLLQQDPGFLRARVRVAWSGGTPTLSDELGETTLFDPIEIGSAGWWIIRFGAGGNGGITPGEDARMLIEPAADLGSNTGSVLVFGASVIIPGMHLDNAVASSLSREGSQFTKSWGGKEAAWLYGTDYFLQGALRRIPYLDQNKPHNETGWDGSRERPMINVGVDSWLGWARDKQPFIWVPNRDDPETTISSLLVEPIQGGPARETDGRKQLVFRIRSENEVPYKGY